MAEALDLKEDSLNVFTFVNEIKQSLENKVDKKEIININQELKNKVN